MTKEEVKTKENPNAKWYVLNIMTGYENSIQKELKQRIETTGMEDKIVEEYKLVYELKTKEEAIEELREVFPRGSTVFSVCRHVSASGMAGWYSFVCFVPVAKGSGTHGAYALHPNYLIAAATGYRFGEKNGSFCIRVNGCGFNRPLEVVQALARALYGSDDALTCERI